MIERGTEVVPRLAVPGPECERALAGCFGLGEILVVDVREAQIIVRRGVVRFERRGRAAGGNGSLCLPQSTEQLTDIAVIDEDAAVDFDRTGDQVRSQLQVACAERHQPLRMIGRMKVGRMGDYPTVLGFRFGRLSRDTQLLGRCHCLGGSHHAEQAFIVLWTGRKCYPNAAAM